jgi:hypothetical protein
MKNSPDRQFEQPLLPASVRQAIGIALLASLPTSCSTTPKQVNDQPPNIAVEIPAATPPGPSDTEEVETQNSRLTPKKALHLALAEPLQFLKRTEEHDGKFTFHACFWRNSKVLIKTNECVNSSLRFDQIIVYIHSPNEGSIGLVANTDYPQKEVYEEIRSNYTNFWVLYSKWRAPNTPYAAWASSPEAYEQFYRELDVSKREERCRLQTPPMHCSINFPQSTAFKRRSEAFWKNPGKDWYTFLQIIKKLHNQHGFQ